MAARNLGWQKRSKAPSASREYQSWIGMIRRCTNPRSNSYRNYGGRGITVCSRWQSFAAFREDMGAGPPGCSIERIDNEKGYSPDNCRWATSAEQRRNQRNSKLNQVDVDEIRFRWDTRTATQAQMAPEYGVCLDMMQELRRVLAIIDADLSDKLTCNELANGIGVCEHYFSSMFRRTLGMTPHRWVLRQRCLTAAELLAGPAPVPEVAERVGFCSQSHLTKVFRKTLGTTPSAYRRSVGGTE